MMLGGQRGGVAIAKPPLALVKKDGVQTILYFRVVILYFRVVILYRVAISRFLLIIHLIERAPNKLNIINIIDVIGFNRAGKQKFYKQKQYRIKTYLKKFKLLEILKRGKFIENQGQTSFKRGCRKKYH
jgi:hypothetical protein